MNNLPLTSQAITILNSQLRLAGELFKNDSFEGINSSIYFMGTKSGEEGLIKMNDLFYRGDGKIIGRSTNTFYPFQDGVAVILESARRKEKVFHEITQERAQAVGASSDLAWVYAFPLFDIHKQIIGSLCLSGSNKLVSDEMKTRLEVMAENLVSAITTTCIELSVPEILKETYLTLD